MRIATLTLQTALRRICAPAAIGCLAALASAAFVACGSEKDDENPQTPTACTAAFRSNTESAQFDCSNREGVIELELNAPAGTPYVIEVTASTDWCWTSRINKTVRKEAVTVVPKQFDYLYYDRNTVVEERTAQVEIHFPNSGERYELVVWQAPAAAPGAPDPVLQGKRWAELPLCTEIEGKTMVVTHFADIASDKRVRNYTLHYDLEKCIADWVAYPIHGSYMSGTYSRSEAWGYDPQIPVNAQANLSAGSYKSIGIRGHQCMSYHRYCPYSTELNRQTYYASNIMPQDYGFNGGLWNEMEGVCTAKSCADTLYCVTGNFGVRATTTDKKDKAIAVPEYCFKVLLRTVSGNTGMAIDKFTESSDASKLMAIGYIAHNSSAGNEPPLRKYCVSVAEVERRTGFTFFTMLDDAVADQVKNQCDPSAWGIR